MGIAMTLMVLKLMNKKVTINAEMLKFEEICKFISIFKKAHSQK